MKRITLSFLIMLLCVAAEAIKLNPMPAVIKQSDGTTLTVISLIGLTAMAGAVGAGGIGDFAIRYGYNRNQFDVTVVSVITLVLLVGIVQLIGGLIVRKVSH